MKNTHLIKSSVNRSKREVKYKYKRLNYKIK